MSDTTVGTIAYDARINTGQLKTDADQADAVAQKTGQSLEKNIGKAAIAVGAAMVGVGAIFMKVTKDSLDSTLDWVGGVKKLSNETGASTESVSKLLYAGQRYGLQVDDISKSLGIFSKHIQETVSGQSSYAIQEEKVRNEIVKTTRELAANNAEIVKNGDKTGELHQKSTDLTLKLKDLNNQLATGGDAFQKLGIVLTDSTGKIRPFDQIFGDVAEKFKEAPNGITETALAMQLFGRSGKDMLPLLNLGREGIQKLGDQAQEFGLVLTKDNVLAFKKFHDASFESEQSAKGLQIQLGLLTLGTMTKLKNVTADLTEKLNNMNAPMKEAASNILIFSGPTLKSAGGVAAFAGGIAELKSAFPGLGAAIAASLGSIGIVVVAIAAAVAAGIIIWKNWDTIVRDLQPVLAVIVPILQNFWNQVVALAQVIAQELAPVIALVTKHATLLKEILLVLIGVALIPIITPLVFLIGVLNALSYAIGFVANHFDLMKQIVVAATLGVAGVIINNWSTIYNFLVSIIGAIINFFQSAWNTVYRIVANALSGVWGAVVNTFSNVVGFIGGIGGQIIGIVSGAGSWLYNAGRNVIQGFLNGMGSLIHTIGSFFLSKLPGWIQAPFKKALGIASPSKVFKGYGKNVVQGFIDGISDTQPLIDSAIDGLTGAVIRPQMDITANGTASAGNNVTINATVNRETDFLAVGRQIGFELSMA